MGMWSSRRLPKKYATRDFEVGATFVCTPDCKSLKVQIFPFKSVFDQEMKSHVSVEGTAVRIEMINGTYECHNYALLNELLKHKAFGRSNRGFTIDKSDPTGFWREADAIETETKEVVTRIVPNINWEKLNAKSIAASVAKKTKPTEDEDGNPVPGEKVEPLTVIPETVV